MTIKRSYLILALLIVMGVLSVAKPLTPYPTYSIYTGPLAFSGDCAYNELAEFVSLFPYRYAGSSASYASAEYVAERFSSLGLRTEYQDFDTYSALHLGIPDEGNMLINPGTTVKQIFEPLTGRNVVGFLPGKSAQTIVIGAHRDVISTIEGAEDNGSGTVVMLKLAEILSQSERNYSYVFVSYDAEEIAVIGSERFAKQYKNLDIILALSLDMLGWHKADSVGFYSFTAAGKRSPLWVYSLTRQMGGVVSASTHNVWQDLLASSREMIPTDTHPFAKRGIPVLGIVATNSTEPGYGINRPIHTPEDRLSIVSADSLGLTGGFVEQFLLTVDSGAVEHGFSSLYLPYAQGVLPPWYLSLSYTALALGLFSLLLYDLYAHSRQSYPRELRLELCWIGGIIGLTALISLYWFSLFSPLLSSVHFAVIIAVGLGLPCVGMLTIAFLRRRLCQDRQATRLIYSLGLLILFVVGFITVGFHKTVILLFIPILMGSSWPVVWLVLFFPVFLSLLVPHLFSFFTTETQIFFSWAMLVWIFSGVYALSKPKISTSATEAGDTIVPQA